MPTALCKPVMSYLAGIKAIVASPGLSAGVDPGMRKRIIESCFRSEYGGSA